MRKILAKAMLTSIAQILVILVSCRAMATTPALTLQGRLTDASSQPIESSTMEFRVVILTPVNQCILFDESQPLDMTNSSGLFSISVNGGVAGTSRNDSNAWTFAQAVGNRGSFPITAANCLTGTGETYTPALSDERKLKLYFRTSSTAAWDSLPVTTVTHSPYAVDADHLGGLASTNYLSFVKSDGTPVTTAPMTDTDYSSLTSLVAGTSTLYAPAATSSSGTVIYSTNGAVSGASVGSMWLDTTGGSDVLKIKTDSGVQDIALSATNSFVNSVAAGTGMAVTTASGTATVSIATAGVDTLQLKDASVTNAKIVAGAVGGSSLDPAINISTTGTVSTAGVGTRAVAISNALTTPNSVTLSVPTTAFPSYSVILPSATPAAGQTLVTNASGQLSWVNQSQGSVTSISAAAVTGNPIIVNGGTTATPTIDITKADATHNGYLAAADYSTFSSKASGSLASGYLYVGNASGVATGVAMSGDATLTNAGLLKVVGIQGTAISSVAPTTAGQVLRYDGTTNYAAGFLSMADIRSTTTPGATIFPSASCAASKTLFWNSLIDQFGCQDIAIGSAQVSGLGSAALLNVGVGSNSVVQLDSSSRLPGVNGSLLTNLNASAITSGTLPTSVLPASAQYWQDAGSGKIAYVGGNVGVGTSAAGAALTLPSGGALGWNNSSNTVDAGLSRGGAAAVFVGDGSPGDASGTLSAAAVGVNTISPATALDVNGAVSVRGMTAPSTAPAGQGRIYFDSVSNRFMVSESSGAYSALATSGGTGGGQTSTTSLTYNTNSDGAGSDGGFNFQANGSNLFAIANNGDLTASSTTASTSSATGALKVAGGVGVAGTINSGASINAATSVMAPQFYGSSAASGNVKIDGTSDATQGNVLLATAGGNVGIGTTAPGYKLDIAGALNAAAIYINGTQFDPGSTSSQNFAGDITMSGAGTGLTVTDSVAVGGELNIAGNAGVGGSFSVTGATTLSGGVTSAGILAVTNTTASTTSSTGAATIAGGLGVAGSLNTAGGINAGTSVTAPQGFLNQVYGSVSPSGSIKIDGTSDAAKGNILLATAGGNVGVGTTAPGYKLDIAGAVNAAALYINGTQFDPGSTSSQNFAGDVTMSGAGTGLTVTNNATVGGALAVTGATSLTGGLTSTGAVAVTNTTAATSSTTGAVTVAGGLGVVGDIYSGATLNAATSVNAPQGILPQIYGSTSAGGNLRIDGTSNGSAGNILLATSGGNIGVGTTAPAVTLDLGTRTDAIRLPSGTTAQEPSGAAGLIRYNTQNSALEFYNTTAAAWQTLGTTSGTQTFSGPTTFSSDVTMSGAGTSLAISNNETVGGNLAVSGNAGVGGSFAVTGATALSGGVTSSGQVAVTNTTASTSSATGAETVAGGLGVAGDIYAGATINAATSLNSPQVYGSSAASGTIKIDGTSNGVAGNILLATSGGNVGIGTTAPNAALQIKAGTTTIAPLRLTAGTNLTTPVAGSIEFDGTTLYYTDSSSVRQALANSTTVSGSYLPLTGGTLTGPVANTNGTAAAPALAFTNDTHTGIYSPAASVIALTTASGERMRVTASGNVGIGTTDPKNSLDVAGGLAVGSYAGANSAATNGMIVSGYVGIGTNNPTSRLTVNMGGLDDTNGIFALNNTFGSTSVTTGKAFSFTVGAENFARGMFYTDGAYGIGGGALTRDVYIRRSAAGTMMIDADKAGGAANLQVTGNVGIGTTASSTYKLDVAGSIRSSATGFVFPDGTTQATAAGGGGAGQWGYANPNVYYTAGNVGIGTDAPVAALHVVGQSSGFPATTGTATTGLFARHQPSGNPLTLDMGGNGSLGAWMQATNSGNLATNYPMLINPNGGNVGIGTTATNFLLDVGGAQAGQLMNFGNGGIGQSNYIGTNGRALFGYNGNTVNAVIQGTSGKGIEFDVNGSFGTGQAMVISSSGNVGIGTDTPKAQLQVANQITGNFGAGQASSNGILLGNTPNSDALTGLTLAAGGPLAGSKVGWESGLIGTNAYYDATTDTIKRYSSAGGFTDSIAITMSSDHNRSGGNRMSFWTGSAGDPAENMSITNSGNVGMGTSAPSFKLDVAGAIRSSATGFVFPDGTTQATAAGGGGAGQWGYANPNVYYTAGNVGIGTDTPSYPLSVTGTSYYNGAAYFTGNVGIGTTSPTAKLNIAAGTTTLAPFQLTAGTNLTTPLSGAIEFDGTNLYYTDSTATRRTLAASGVAGSYLPLAGGTMTGALVHANGSASAPSLSFASDTTSGIYSPSAGAVGIGTTGVERLRITNAGNVGIGTTTPGYKLDVSGSLNATSINLNGSPLAADLWSLNGSNVYRSSGNVGIGTTAPGALLEIGNSTTGTASLILNRGSSDSNIQFESAGTAVGQIRSVATGGLKFTNGGSGTEWMRFDSSGNVGIGTTAPAFPLTIWSSGQAFESVQNGGTGTAVFEFARVNHATQNNAWGYNISNGGGALANGSLAISPQSSSDATAVTADLSLSGLYNGYANGGQLVIKGLTGNIGVGTTAPAYKLDVAGAINGTQLLVNGVDVSAGAGAWTVSGGNTYRASGNVGIGTTAPATALQVIGNTTHGNSGSRTVTIGDALAPSVMNYAQGYIGFNATDVSGTWTSKSDGSHNGGIAQWAGINGDYFLATIPNSGTPTAVQTLTDTQIASNVKFMIGNNGNVGIGTTSPVGPLDVAGTAGHVYVGNAGNFLGFTGPNANYIAANGSGGALNFQTNGSNTRMTIDSSGNVGIGTTSPSTLLNIASAFTSGVATPFRMDSTGGSNNPAFKIQLNDTTNTVKFASVNSTPKFSFGNNSYDYLTVDNSSGNIGIGTTAPMAKLNIAAGTAALAPLQLTAGTNLTTPVSGAIEFDGTSLYYTDSTATRHALAASGVSGSYLPLAGGTMTGAIVHTAGTATAPSLSFSTDTTTGIYSPSAGVVGIGTTGVERMRVTAAGNVGIGTTAPNAPLEVAGKIYATDYVATAGGTVSSPTLRFVGDANTGIYHPAGNALGIVNGGVEALRIASGNVGIGTTAPGFLLDVGAVGTAGNMANFGSGSAAISNYVTMGSQRALFGYSGLSTNTVVQATTGKGIEFNVNSGSFGAGQAMVVTSGGNVGIGTTAPSYKLDVAGAMNATSIYLNGTALSATNAGAWTLNSSSLYPTSTGYNVGIGTTAPSAVLHVVGQSPAMPATSGTTTSGLAHRNQGGANSATLDIGVAGSAGTWLQSTNVTNLAANYPLLLNPNGGNVGIGTTAPITKLQVAGAVLAAGNISTTAGQIYDASKDNGSVTLSSASPAAIDWNNGNIQRLALGGTGCDGTNTSFSFSNMMDGGSYTLIVDDTAAVSSGKCLFKNGTDTILIAPTNAQISTSQPAVFTLMKMGTTIYISWINGSSWGSQ